MARMEYFSDPTKDGGTLGKRLRHGAKGVAIVFSTLGLLIAGTVPAAIMVRKSSWVTPGPVYAHIQDALNVAGDGDEVYVDATDGCEPVHLVRRVKLIGTGDIGQSDWSPGKSCISTLSFDQSSIGTFVKGFVVGSIVGDSNLSIKISNCHVTGNIDIHADAGYKYIESTISDGGEDFGYNSVVDIGHNVIDGNVNFPGHVQRVVDIYNDTSYVQVPGQYSYLHNNLIHGSYFALEECNGVVPYVDGCAYPWPDWGPDSVKYVAKTPRAYMRRADLDRAAVTQGDTIRVRFQGLMAAP